MNNRHNNYFSMFRTVIMVCLAHKAALAKVKAFDDALKLLIAKLAEIKLVAAQQKVVLTGIADDKHAQKKALAKMGSIIAASVKGYAHKAGNLQLVSEVKFSESALASMKEEDLILTSENIHKKAFDNLAVLIDHGIDAALLTQFETMTTAFADKKPEPAAAKVNKETLTDKLEVLYDDANNIIKKQMDNNSKIFQLLDPDFYELYKGARKIIDRRGKITNPGSLKGTVTGILDSNVKENQPLDEVLLHLIEPNLVIVTNENGLYDFEEIEAGKYTLKVIKQGFIDQIIKDLEIKNGEDKVLDLVLVKG